MFEEIALAQLYNLSAQINEKKTLRQSPKLTKKQCSIKPA